MRYNFFTIVSVALAAAAAVGSSPTSAKTGGRQIPPLIAKDLATRDLDYTQNLNWPEGNTKNELLDVTVNEHTLKVNCTDCKLAGKVKASCDILSQQLKISFSETKGYINTSIHAGAGAEYAIPLLYFGAISVAGSTVNLGLGFYLEMVVSVDSELKATGGFSFTIPEGSSFVTDWSGDVVEKNFDGAEGDVIDWDMPNGSTTMKVSLRLRTEFGFSTDGLLDLLPIPEAAVGVYLNLAEVVIDFEKDKSDKKCLLEVAESWNINAGAYGGFDVGAKNTRLEFATTKSNTLYNGPTATQCLSSAASSMAHSSAKDEAASTASALQTKTRPELTTTLPPKSASTVYATITSTVTKVTTATITQVATSSCGNFLSDLFG